MTTTLKKSQTAIKTITIAQYPISSEKKVDFHLTYEVFGQPLYTAPIILVNHALTGNSHVAGKGGWWKTLIGKDKRIDLNKYTVIAFNCPGNAYKGNKKLPISYQELTTKIVANLYWKALQKLGIEFLYAVIGSSLGGGIAWEMAFLQPKSIRHLIPIATNLKASDWVIGHVLIQDNILNHSRYPVELARREAMHFYRTPKSFWVKFHNQFKREEQQYAVESWLKYHGKALKDRLPVQAYKTMNHLLKTIGQTLTLENIQSFAEETTTQIRCIAVNSDLLFTADEQRETVNFIKNYHPAISYKEIHSPHGHDAFLIAYDQLDKALKRVF